MRLRSALAMPLFAMLGCSATHGEPDGASAIDAGVDSAADTRAPRDTAWLGDVYPASSWCPVTHYPFECDSEPALCAYFFGQVAPAGTTAVADCVYVNAGGSACVAGSCSGCPGVPGRYCCHCGDGPPCLAGEVCVQTADGRVGCVCEVPPP